MKITLIVSGSIAAYKSAELVRELGKRAHTTHVVLTEGGEKFITSLTLQTLSGNPVTKDLFDEVREGEINHIRLADSADVVAVAPASANILAKMAHGIADDAATTVLLATRSPVVIAPAMNVNMWQNVATRENVELLKHRGVLIVPPEEGELACGWEGAGRLAETAVIADAIEAAATKKDLSGVRMVVSAGPTREAIDPMRFVSNRSSGKMGYALAERARLRGADVVLVSGPTGLPVPSGVSVRRVISAHDMQCALGEELRKPAGDRVKQQLLIMAAAVCDHRPEAPSAEKLKQVKKSPYSLSLVPNEDIVHSIALERESIEQLSGVRLSLAGFAAESAKGDALLEYASKKLRQKGLDAIIANSLEEAAESDSARVWILRPDRPAVELGLAGKKVLADKILDTIREI